MGIIKISHRLYSKLNMQNMEAHNFYEIYFLLHGDRQIFIENQSFEAHKNSFFIISPQTLHKTMGNNLSERINIYISKDKVLQKNLEFLERYNNTHLTLNEIFSKVVHDILKSAAHKGKEEDPESLYSIVNFLLFYLRSSAIANIYVVKETDSVFSSLMTYINKHYTENISISDLCKVFFISKNTLFRLFHKNLQCTVYEYILLLRLNCAKHLLSTTTDDMESIATACGFNSANYFSMTFKRNLGISPRAYRKNSHLNFD